MTRIVYGPEGRWWHSQENNEIQFVTDGGTIRLPGEVHWHRTRAAAERCQKSTARRLARERKEAARVMEARADADILF